MSNAVEQRMEAIANSSLEQQKLLVENMMLDTVTKMLKVIEYGVENYTILPVTQEEVDGSILI